jgi:acetyl esterase/lipase
VGVDIAQLLELRTWRALDIDDDGRVLAANDDGGSLQLVELDPDGTSTPLTALAGPCTGRWLPGERVVVVEHDSGGDENGQLSLLRPDAATGLPAGLDDLEPLVHAPGVKHTLLDVGPGRVVYSTNRRNRVDFDVVSREVPTGTETVLYDGGGNVESVSVGADGVAVIGLVGSRPISTRLLLAVPGEPARPLTDPDLAARHEHAHRTPDGAAVIVTTDRGRDFTGIARLDLGTGDRSWLVTDDTCDLAAWPSPNGRLLLVEASVDGGSRLALHDARTGELLHPVPLPGQGTAVAGVAPMNEPVWSPDGARIALSFSSPVLPGDVLVVQTASGAVTTLASSAVDLAPPELTSHRVPTPDGEQVPCFVFAPTGPTGPTGPGAVSGSAVVVIHGGPESQAYRTFSPVVAALTAAGHVVLVPNVRGSRGYGRRWTSLDDVRLRLDSVADLAALHAWLPAIGVDPSRCALWGGSYGGYMVLAGLTMQPGLWAAGVDIVGISSLVTFLEHTSPYRLAAREREYGSLAEDREFLEEASPLTHLDALRSPLFVIHGANDPRVPLSETEQLVEQVRARGIECALHVYPDEGHGLARRVNRLDAYPRAMHFIQSHLARS